MIKLGGLLQKSIFVTLLICTFFNGVNNTVKAENNYSSKLLQQTPTRNISGRVVDGDNEPLIGVTILVKGTRDKGGITDLNGDFNIFGVENTNEITLVFSMIGFVTKEVKVVSSTPITIVLEEDIQQLEDFVVVGYGTEKKRNIAGAVSNISSSELGKNPIEDFQKAMQGKVAGVQITSANGTPGGAVNVLIRGSGSFNAKTTPLYIIDGVQVITGDNSSGIIKSTDALSALNPSEIQSIDILKDGASASIYGAQAANGVVIITTKKGVEGRNKISVSLSGGMQKITNKVDVLTGPQVAELDLIAHKNRYGESSPEYINRLNEYRGYGWGENGYSNTPTYNWYDLLYRTAYVGDAQISITGGSAKEKHFLSGAFNSTDGVLIGTGFNRGAFRLNFSFDLAKWVTLSTNNSFTVMNQDQQSNINAANPNRTSLVMHPANTPYDSEGNFLTNLQYGYFMHNTLQMMKLNEYNGRTNKLLSANALDFKLLDGLTFKSSYNVEMQTINEHLFIDPRTREGERANGEVTASTNQLVNFQSEQVLSYNTFVNEIHRISSIAGVSYRHETYRSHSATGTGVSHPTLHLLSSTAIPTNVSQNFSEWKMASAFARLNYTLLDRYIFNTTLRRDGSSRFGESNKWGWFPSFSGAWRIIDEDFMETMTIFSDLRLRASYGVTGNSDIGNYVARRWYSSGGAYNNISAIIPASIGNPYLTWEKSHSKNIGISTGLFNDRIYAEFDLYVKDTKDLLYNRTIPATTGFTVIPSNMGGIRNSGVEVLLNTVNVNLKNGFKWSSSFNISFNKNEIIELQDGLEELGGYKVGKALSSVLTYHWAGVNEADGRPMYYDKDGYITYNPTDKDRVWTNPAEPKYFGAFNNDISWKGFELSASLQFQNGGMSYWYDKVPLLGSDGDQNLLLAKYTEYWKKPGDVTWIPKPSFSAAYPGNPRKIDQTSTLHYEKTDYIKLKSIMLSYHFDKKVISPLLMSGLQIYVSAYNLLTWTNYPGQDPEFTGSDVGSYPQSRSYNIGLKMDF